MMIATNTKLTSTTANANAVCIVFDSTSEMIGLGHHEDLFCNSELQVVRPGCRRQTRSLCQQLLGLSITYLQNNVIWNMVGIDRQEILSKVDE